MYGDFFDIPEPETLIFISWFESGDVFRSGAVWTRGKGNIFYFRPGHETFPIYQNPEIIQVLENAVHWAAFTSNTAIENTGCINAAEPHEPIARTEKTEG
jgi:trehalose utilization protein